MKSLPTHYADCTGFGCNLFTGIALMPLECRVGDWNGIRPV